MRTPPKTSSQCLVIDRDIRNKIKFFSYKEQLKRCKDREIQEAWEEHNTFSYLYKYVRKGY